MAQYIILGLGEFGMTVATSLAEAKQEVLCMDSDEARVQAAAQKVARAMTGDVANRETLLDLPLAEVDAVVLAVGDNLEASVLATLHLKEAGVKRIIAKATWQDHARILRALGVDQIISPEREMGRKVAQQLITPNTIDYIPIQRGVSVRELAPPPSFVGKTVGELDLRKKWKVEILAVRDASQDAVELIPSVTLTLDANDRLIVIGKDDDLDALGKAE